MAEADIPVETQIILIQQEMQLFRNSVYMAGVRHRVQKRLGSKEGMEANEKELERLEQALDELQTILDELKQPDKDKA